VYYRNGQSTIGGSAAVDHGFIELFGRRWDINRANASFEAEAQPNPRIDVEIQHSFQTTTVFVDVTGTVREPKLDLRAEPGNYDQAQILAWVLGGDPDAPSNTDKQPLQDKAVGVASNLLLGQVQSQLRDALPIDVLNVQVGEATSPTTTRIEVGKWLTDTLFLGYQGRLNANELENTNEAEIQWRFGRRWLLDAFFGDRGVGGADVLWSKLY
jgi:translocation and assembly module TamB